MLDCKVGDIKCSSCASIFNAPILDRARLVSHFYEASAEAFTQPELWKIHPALFRLSTRDITSANRSISCLEIAIHNDNIPWLKASVDIVPTILFDRIPLFCSIPNFLQLNGCRAVSKWYSGDPDNTQLFRLSFCMYDEQLFDQMPIVLKDAFKLAKIVKDDCFCPILKNDFQLRLSQIIDSFVLKNCTLKILLDTVEKGEKVGSFPTDLVIRMYTIRSDCPDYIKDVIYWCYQIYQVLFLAIETKPKPYLQSVYIQDCNLLEDDKFGQFQELTLEYIRGVQLMLPLPEYYKE